MVTFENTYIFTLLNGNIIVIIITPFFEYNRDIIICRNILSKGGSVVDATLASMFCNGVVNSQSMGLGGGFIMTIYKKNEGKAYSLVARDSAPENATQTMFSKQPSLSQTGIYLRFINNSIMYHK